MGIFFYMLSDPETNIGYKSMKLLGKLAWFAGDCEDSLNIFKDQFFLDKIEEVFKNEDSTIELRFFESIIEAGNRNEKLYRILEENGKKLVTRFIDLYEKYEDDILSKLNLITVLGKVADTATGCGILTSHTLFSKIKAEATAPNADIFVTRALSTLLIDLMNHGKIPFRPQMLLDIRDKILFFLSNSSGEELHCVFEMIKSLGRSIEGFKMVMKNKSILKWLINNCLSNKSLEQGVALNALKGMFEEPKFRLTAGGTISLEKFNKTNFQCIEALICYFGDSDLLQYESFEVDDEKKIQKGVDSIVKYLMLPFPEQEMSNLFILRQALTIPRVLNLYCRNPEGIHYLVRKLAGNKEILDSKNELTDFV